MLIKRKTLPNKGHDEAVPLVCAPGMGADLKVEVLYGGGSTEPLAKGKGVIVRWGPEEAGGKVASR